MSTHTTRQSLCPMARKQQKKSQFFLYDTHDVRVMYGVSYCVNGQNAKRYRSETIE